MYFFDMAYKSDNHYGEELCGDHVELLHTADSHILILTDGMGSGVKANILAILSAKILSTMFQHGATIDECVTTIAETLPICQERFVAYATFVVLQVYNDGTAYLAEYDNPETILIRDCNIMTIPRTKREIEGKIIREAHFQAKEGDVFVAISDGCLYASTGIKMDMNWNWDKVAAFIQEKRSMTKSASRLANLLVQECTFRYGGKNGDDTTAAVMRIKHAHHVKLLTGPAEDPQKDAEQVHNLMEGRCTRIVCGGTSAQIVSKVLNRELTFDQPDPKSPVPPMSHIQGIHIVSEGVLTLNKVVQLLHRYVEDDDIDEEFFEELDEPNAASMIASRLIENCTKLDLLVGQAINPAYQNPQLSFDLTARKQLCLQLKELLEKLEKEVHILYY